MDNTHLLIIIVILIIFSITGMACGIIIHEHSPAYIKEDEIVRNSFIFLIISFIFVIIFSFVFFYWFMLDNHNSIRFKHSTRMHHGM